MDKVQTAEGALDSIAKLCEAAKGTAVPFLIQLLPSIFKYAAHKKSKAARANAEAAGLALAKVLPSNITAKIMPVLFEQFDVGAKWQSKLLALKMLSVIADESPDQISDLLVEIIPQVSTMMWDSKKQVKNQATETMEFVCAAIDNKDVIPFVPSLIEAITDPTQVTECVHALAATTFVQTVRAPALSITVPLLNRGFNEKTVATIRKCAVITENMAKLVEDAADVAPFMPVLLPHLERVKEDVADPECRKRCTVAYDTLKRIGSKQAAKVIKADLKKTTKAVETAMAGASATSEAVVTDFVGELCCSLINLRIEDEEEWVEDLSPALSSCFTDADAAAQVAKTLFEKLAGEGGVDADDNADEADDAETLCNCKFSLAYGAKILLNNAQLYLKRGRRYGIIAQKSAGKTTLLRSIASGQIDGFPDASELKTVFVEHDIMGSQVTMNVVEFTLDTCAKEGVTRERVVEMLSSIGFTDEMKAMPITSLSGGWKMKLGLARAILRKADILLMDEPTNHLDVLNVQWVVDYLTGDECTNVTSIIVSHDTKFLDNVATHIIHFADLKLKNYLGNMSKFVEIFPEAKAYFDLSATTMKFKFPCPGPLMGVRNKGKAILEIENVWFKYPGCEKYQIKDVTAKVSMSSRIAIVGANGAGKSTMIKVLTGENPPTKGKMKKHPNCRFAYVAQHAFHHIEQHLDKTPNEYVQWRYQGGQDKEALVKSTTKISPEEEKLMAKPIEVLVEREDKNGEVKKIKEKRIIEKLMARRKAGKKNEYEAQFKGRPQSDNVWYDIDLLVERGWKKKIDELDRRLAAAAGNARTLSAANIQKHFEDVGLEAELSTHNRIRSLSGGQKVKVVLGACTWSQPHLIILDEPTNYLDRDSLGALSNAIKDFEGGVCLITHNKEFADSCTRETWVIANNQLTRNADAEWEKYAQEALEIAAQEEALDAFGNKVEKKRTVESVKGREKKKMMKDLRKRIKNDMEMTQFEEDCAAAWGLFAA
jgi:elongation factor 3